MLTFLARRGHGQLRITIRIGYDERAQRLVFRLAFQILRPDGNPPSSTSNSSDNTPPPPSPSDRNSYLNPLITLNARHTPPANHTQFHSSEISTLTPPPTYPPPSSTPIPTSSQPGRFLRARQTVRRVTRFGRSRDAENGAGRS